MKKKEVRLYCAQLVECGKGLALASMLDNGSEARQAAERVFENQIDNICKQLELYCEDVDFKEAQEYLEDGN